MTNSKNIYNDNLTLCGNNPKTGFYRNGYCDTGQDDVGTHTVCSSMNDDFLNYTKEKGNDLSSPSGSFPGLKSGDRWCLCALRWKEAYQAGKAPPVDLSATHAKTLDYVNKSLLEKNNNSSENFRGGGLIPCGENGENVIPQNNMTSKQVLNIFLDNIKNKDISRAMLYTTFNKPKNYNKVINIFKKISKNSPFIYNTHHINDCTVDYTINTVSKNNKQLILLISLKRQWKSSNNGISIPYNSMYWRITNVRKLN